MMVSMRSAALCAALAAVTFSASAAHAAVTVTADPAGAFAPGYTIVSPAGGDGTTVSQTNQFQTGGNALTQTFTVTSGFQLDRITILGGGRAGGTLTLSIYPLANAFEGGQDADGYVNTSFATDLLGGGAGATAVAFGNGGTNLTTFNFTGTDEVTLAPGRYAFDVKINGDATSSFSWIRSNQSEYTGGNIYQGAIEGGFNGTPPANGRGQRNAVGGSPQRDGLFAMYAVAPIPEPTSLAAIGLGAMTLVARRRRA